MWKLYDMNHVLSFWLQCSIYWSSYGQVRIHSGSFILLHLSHALQQLCAENLQTQGDKKARTWRDTKWSAGPQELIAWARGNESYFKINMTASGSAGPSQSRRLIVDGVQEKPLHPSLLLCALTVLRLDFSLGFTDVWIFTEEKSLQ